MYIIFLGTFMGFFSDISGKTFLPQYNGDIVEDEKKFAGWTEKQYKHYEDSVLSQLYPPVVVRKLENIPVGAVITGSVNSKQRLMPMEDFSAPNIDFVDRGKEVGEIPIHSGITPTGAKTYNIPISVYSGMKGLTPDLALTYNSQQGNSVLGVGWSVSGISMIVRGGKTLYYDGKTEGVKLDNSDSFMLNGVRLIKISSANDHILYESEQGNIKVKGFFSGTTMKYFEVFFPNGNRGVFGDMSNSQNLLAYPIFLLNDLHGNTINYEYSYNGNHYSISKISYNGNSVEFQYTYSRTDPISSYTGGMIVAETRLLKEIISKHGANILGTYTLSYTVEKDKSLLTRVDFSADGNFYNPISFRYGEGNVADVYTISTTQLSEWYESEGPNMLKVVRGRFDYFNHADGLIVLPNKNPYWKHYRHFFPRRSQKRFINQYRGDEKIFLYTGLKDNFTSPMPNLYTEEGFVDIICGDLEGNQEEYIVKINDKVVNNNDQITFNVYRSNLYTGLTKICTRNYSFPTVYKDANEGKSIQPKFYYTGDFNGDGKMEVLAVSVNHPFDDTGKPSMCYVFDLMNDKIMYQGHVFPFNIDFVGTRQENLDAANNNSDKLLVMDYDGDGKSDICHINEEGVHIYTFETAGTTICGAKKVNSATTLRKSTLADRRIVMGEFNGDGLTDLLVSPLSKNSNDRTWVIYFSRGDGRFDSSTFYKDNKEGLEFMGQDVNGDGTTDLISYDVESFITHLTTNRRDREGRILMSNTCYNSFPSKKSILIPTNINSRNSFTQLISLKDGKVTKYSFSNDYGKEMLVTSVKNSLGIIEKNQYTKANQEGFMKGVYNKGDGAVFPYVNIQEPLNIVASSETYMNEVSIESHSYRYRNAVIHRQGLGFCGFEEIMSLNNKSGRTDVSTYEPYRRGVLKSINTPMVASEFSYSITTQNNRLLKILLTKKIEEDLLKNITVSTSYAYDAYGYPTEENTVYSDGTNVRKINRYAYNTKVGQDYHLGYLCDHIATTTRGKETHTERLFISDFSRRQPKVMLFYKNNNIVKRQTFSYDSHGNTLNSTVTPYSSSNGQVTKYNYDSFGRVTKTTNPMGLVTEFTYNAMGQIASIKDFRGGVTTYSYDAFGRETSVIYPDQSKKTIELFWLPFGELLYGKKQETTGEPTTTTYYDAMKRTIRTSEVLLNGENRNVDRVYDNEGHLQKVSLPFLGESPLKWNTYYYDFYGRVVLYMGASGESVEYKYNGNSVTTTSKDMTKTETYDALGNLISVTDPAGTVTYKVAADGKPMSVVAPGKITTSFEYDKYRRRVKLVDPSMGTTTYEYNAEGNISKETDANGKVKQYVYDQYGRLSKSSCPEFVTLYKYNSVNDLTEVSTSNGTGESFAYDVFGRITCQKEIAPDGKWLQRDYSYINGKVGSIRYRSPSGEFAKEDYVYENGSLKAVKLNGKENIYNITSLNSLGVVSEVSTGAINRNYDYTSIGLLTGRRGSSNNKKYQDFSYVFDANTSNLISRKDNTRNLSENFEYDNLNRLTTFGGKQTSYDNRGNIIGQSDIGTFDYAIAQKPYAVSEINLSSNRISTRSQDITYTSFSRPKTISENGYTAEFIYTGDYDRVKMTILQKGNKISTRYYMGDCYELEETPETKKERLYLGGDYYSAPTVLVREKGLSKLYYILRDHLGSITHIIDADGKLIQELSYDAWGRLRNPDNHQIYEPGMEPNLFLGRGYTGHEHLVQFGLINMNARLYDAALGRFLSPDPYVQMPDFTQNFNRYSYGLNNPLKYIDKDGEFVHLIVGIAIVAGAYFGGSAANGTFNPIKWNYSSWKTHAGMVVGGVAGYAGATLGASVAASAVASGYSSIAAGVAGGMVGGMVSGAINGAGMTAINGGSFSDMIDAVSFGTVMGGFGGAFSGGIGAAIGDFSGIAGSSFKNALCELGHSTLKGFATGLAGGAMISAMKQDASYLIKGAFIGASIGTLTTALKIFTLGTTFDPAEIASITKVERLGQVYRRGSFLFKKGSGITLGNNLSIRLTNNLEYDRHLIQHETAHFLQIQKLGLVNFYLRVLREYFKYGFYDSYKTPGTLEYNAEMYARDGVLLF